LLIAGDQSKYPYPTLLWFYLAGLEQREEIALRQEVWRAQEQREQRTPLLSLLSAG
jgi:hypothetical protein